LLISSAEEASNDCPDFAVKTVCGVIKIYGSVKVHWSAVIPVELPALPAPIPREGASGALALGWRGASWNSVGASWDSVGRLGTEAQDIMGQRGASWDSVGRLETAWEV